MAVVIRFARRGSKGSPFYRIVAADKERPRDGKFLEVLGNYNPKNKALTIDNERVKYWIDHGAIPSDRVAILMIKKGMKFAEKFQPVFVPKEKKKPEVKNEESTQDATQEKGDAKKAEAETSGE